MSDGQEIPGRVWDEDTTEKEITEENRKDNQTYKKNGFDWRIEARQVEITEGEA